MRSDRDRLLDILEAIERIGTQASRGREVFERDELVRTFIVHHLQIIGEAAAKVSQGLCRGHPEIAWQQIVAMRHILVHDYFRVDENEVWTTVERDLPSLKTAIEKLLGDLAQ